MKCSTCGAEGNGQFCPNCGTPLEQPTGQRKGKRPKKPKKPIYKRVWFWIVVGIIVIGIIGGSFGEKSDNFSEGFEAGREAAKQTDAPVQETAQPSPEATPADESEFGLDTNGNPGPDRIALITYAETAMEDILKQDVSFLYIGNGADTFDISKTNLRYIIKGKCKVDDAPYEVIVKLEFDEAYETYEVFQLKLDGKNIDL